MPSTAEFAARGAAPQLMLRAPRMPDEAVMRAAHEELSAEGFSYLFHPECSWGEQLHRIEEQSRGVNLPSGQVRSDFLVAELLTADGHRPPERGLDAIIVGRVSIRHTLTPLLFEIGGHVGYAVRPGFRGRGYATQMLTLSVERLGGLGVKDVLVTCDEDNVFSIRVIERCGGVLEDTRRIADEAPAKRRYWIDSRA